jgi:hypothetical protein
MANETFTQLLGNYFDARINLYHHTKMPNNPTPDQIQTLSDNIAQDEQALNNIIGELA